MNKMFDKGTEFMRKELQEEQPCGCNCLPNELLINIFEYLPHTDLQKVREVCNRWHHITSLHEFMGKSKFIINAKNVATISKCLHSDEEFPTRMKYDTVEIKGLEASNDLCLILNALYQNVRKVDLYDSPVFSLLNTSTPQLEELVVFQSSDRAHTNLTVEMNFTRFKNFKSLDMSDLVTPDIHKSLLLKLADDRSLKMENLSLVVFGGQEQLIIDTLRHHCQSLKHLTIRLSCYLKEQTQWYQLFASFRQLESLKIHGWYNKHWIKEIMECLPGDINLRHIDVLCRSEDDLLLEQIIKKWPQSLENINLVGWDNITNDGVAGFSKLQLKNFKMSCCKYISLQGLLEGVAKERNTTLKTLILIDMGSRDRECMMLLTQRLPNLTYLSLANCRKSVDNYTLASIFDNMPNLQHLILEKCHRIRNKGLLGFGSNPAPISKLKGLQTLNLSGCRRLTNFGKGLKLNELRKLNLSFCRNITSRDIRELVRNCPALEDLVVCGCSVISDYDVLHIAQGLRRLKRLDLGYCIKLTPKSIDYLMEFGKSLRKLDIYCIKSLHSFPNTFRF